MRDKITVYKDYCDVNYNNSIYHTMYHKVRWITNKVYGIRIIRFNNMHKRW
jgi:hypothetical protein